MPINRFVKNLSIFTILIFAVSCSLKIKNFDRYQKQFLSKSDFMPDEKTLEQKLPRIAVLDLEDSNDVAKKAQLGNSIARNIENVISKNHLAELVDRSVASKLEKEIMLSEMKKSGSYKGPKVADYVVSGAISDANFISKYSSGTTYVNPKDLTVVSTQPSFTYTASVAGNIKIYELPSLDVVSVIEFDGKKSRSENAQRSGGVNIMGIQIGGDNAEAIKRDDGLIRRAGEIAILDLETEIKNSLVKNGYILEKRVYDDSAIFKINLGSQDGISYKDSFEVIGQYEVENPITGKNETEKRIIATGKVSDKIDFRTSWIVIDDQEKVNSIRLGDIVKMKYKKTSTAILKKAIHNAIN